MKSQKVAIIHINYKGLFITFKKPFFATIVQVDGIRGKYAMYCEGQSDMQFHSNTQRGLVIKFNMTMYEFYTNHVFRDDICNDRKFKQELIDNIKTLSR